MKKQEIEQHPAWKYICTLNPKERFNAFDGVSKLQIAEKFDCQIQLLPHTELDNITGNQLILSVTDPFRYTSYMVVLTPNK